MKILVLVITCCALLLAFVQLAEARKGRNLFAGGGNGRTLLAVSDDNQLTKDQSVQLPVDETNIATSNLKKLDEESSTAGHSTSEKIEADDDEIVCTELGTCYEKRLLTATIDYKSDGPNNPITDPPH